MSEPDDSVDFALDLAHEAVLTILHLPLPPLPGESLLACYIRDLREAVAYAVLKNSDSARPGEPLH